MHNPYCMASVSSAENFNVVMRAFMVDLTDVFPENDALQSSLEKFDELVKINFKKPQKVFIDLVGKFTEQIIKRDETVFDHLKFPGFSFKNLWEDDISAGTRGAIWDYLNQLIFLCV